MEKISSSDDFVCDHCMANRVSGCTVAHLEIAACVATDTGHHVKVGVLRPASASFQARRTFVATTGMVSREASFNLVPVAGLQFHLKTN